jgi:hypothetical protein
VLAFVIYTTTILTEIALSSVLKYFPKLGSSGTALHKERSSKCTSIFKFSATLFRLSWQEDPEEENVERLTRQSLMCETTN